MNKQACWSRWAGALLLLGAGLGSAQAQTAEAEAAPAESAAAVPVEPLRTQAAPMAEAAADEAVHLDDVVVTATKREKPLRDIPASIASLPAEQLEDQGVQGVEGIAKLVPGVNVTSDLGISRVTIRGISAETGTNMTTGIAFGNVSFTDSYVPLASLDPNPFDLQSVEVLKGPQGTLFGAAALNGLVRYVPEPPKFGEWQARYFAQYTDISEGGSGMTYGAALNVPLGSEEKYALRVMGFDRDAPGYVDNLRQHDADANGMKQRGARAIFGARPGEDWSMTLTGAWQESAIHDALTTDNLDGVLSTGNRSRSSPQDTAYTLGALSMSYEGFDWAQLVSESSFVRKESHNFSDLSRGIALNGAVSLLAIHLDADSDSWTQELRLVSVDDGDSPWQWVAGAFGSRQQIEQTLSLALTGLRLPLPATLLNLTRGLTNSYGEPVAAIENPQVVVQEYALFGDVTRKFGAERQWELSLGGRLYQTSSGGVNKQSGVLLVISDFEFNHELRGEVKENGFSPKVSLTWHATDQVLAYAAASRGFRVGGIQPGITTAGARVAAPEFFKSDTIWNYEGGLRTEWFGKALRLDLTGYLERWKDPQTIQPDSNGLSNYIDNAGGVKSTGADVSLQCLLPIPGFMLRASASYAQTVTTETFTTGSGRVSMPGDPWPFAPEWQTATTLAWQGYGESWQLGAGLTHSYLGAAVNNLGELAPVFGYQQWDTYVKAASPAYRWLPEVTLTVSNLTDTRGIVQRIAQGSQNDVGYVTPRAIILRLGGNF